MKHWYDYDITELNESMFDETCENGFSDDNVGDAPDTTVDNDIDGFKYDGSDDDSGFSESDEGIIDSDWYDGKVEPSTIPQNKTEDSAYGNDPSKVNTIKNDAEGTDEVEMESFFDDVDYDLF